MNFPPQMTDPLFDAVATLSPDIRRDVLHHQRHWIQHMINTGRITLAPGVVLHVNERGFITSMHRDTLSVDLLR